MSRIGKLPIKLPTGVTVNVNQNTVTVKGKLGEMSQDLTSSISVEVENGNIVVKRPSDSKSDRSLHGLYRALISNMVKGVSEGYEINLELVGVGYRAESNGQALELALGFSHPIVFLLPDEVKVEAKTARGTNPTIRLFSTDKQLLGQIAAKLRTLRPPEPYKGKGIKFVGEVLRRKAGKTSSK
jgi:large subunit ribosomal protein L6